MKWSPIRMGHAVPLTAIGAVGGLALLAYTIGHAGVPEIVDGLRSLGFGFVLVLLLSGVRFTARTLGWMTCIEGLPRLPFRDALSAKLIGDALGSLTPLGLLLSEPAKAMLVRGRVQLSHALSAMLVENIFHTISVVAMISIGTCWVLVVFPVPAPLRWMSLALFAGAAIFACGGALLLITRPTLVSGILDRLRGRGFFSHRLHETLDKIRVIEERVYGFAKRHPERLPLLLALTLTFHAAAIAEVYVTLAFVSGAVAPTFLTAFLLETVNRIVTVAFTFVPLRLGVDEAATGFASNLLQFGTAAGVTLALVRKARLLCWSTVGALLLALRGFTTRP